MKNIANKTKFHLSAVTVFSFFILLSFIMTFPLIFKMSTHLYGSGGDSFGTVWGFWWHKYARINPISSSLCPLLAAPFGFDLSQAPFSFFATRILPLLTLLFNEIFAYNFYVLISFPLSAITMYYLARYFTKNSGASMLAGIIYGFCPYHFVHATQHLSLANIQWMPLYILSLFKLDEERNYKSALLCAFAFSLVFLSDYYYGYFMTIFTGVFIVWRVWYRLRNRRLSDYQIIRLSDKSSSPFRTVKVMMVAVAVALAIVLPAIQHILKTIFRSQTEAVVSLAYERAFSGLFTYSAQLFHYLVPSGNNPFIGGFTRNFIKVYHPIEQTLYLGWVGIILSIIAIREWRRRSKVPSLMSKVDAKQLQKGVSFFLFGGIIALLFSHAAWTDIGPFRILFPSYFMYKIVPMFRIYARFGILVMLSVSVLAGIGLAGILQKIKSPKKQGILVTVIVLLVFIEFTPTFPIPMVDAIHPPPVYAWLAKRPGDFIIAEYPLRTEAEYIFWQRIHKKRMVNGTVPGTYADELRKEIVDILSPETPGILKYLGTEYVIFHPEEYQKSDEIEIIGELPDFSQQKGLKLVETFDDAQVYVITAESLEPKID